MKRMLRVLLLCLIASGLLSAGCTLIISTPERAATPAGPAQPAQDTADRAGKEPPSSSAMPDTKELIRAIQPTVVSITAQNMLGTSQGSGFLIDQGGHVLTNAHVVQGARFLQVQTYDGKSYQAKIVGSSDEMDVALLYVEGLRGRTPAPLGSASSLEVGDEVLAFGSPLGLENTVTTGIISGLNRSVRVDGTYYSGLIQISAPIAPGNSGGPLVLRATGKVVGINTVGASVGNIGLSIPLDHVLPLVHAWKEGRIQAAQGSEPPKDVESEAVALVDEFYRLVNEGHYEAAYELLGTGFRRKLPLDRFVRGYNRTVSTWIADRRVRGFGPDGIVIDAWVDAVEQDSDGRLVMHRYHFVYTVGQENGVLRILRGKLVDKERLP